ncbi:MAG TPA: hypothetical protein VK524_33680 [Polyangiaceae bacterium]|nr:hypothetical protein [Polyangiaceae bacterium]
MIERSRTSVVQCRGIELSPTGILLDRGRRASAHAKPLFVHLELVLPEQARTISAIARPIWQRGSQQALKFIRISDADRLTLAEHLDLLERRGAVVC